MSLLFVELVEIDQLPCINFLGANIIICIFSELGVVILSDYLLNNVWEARTYVSVFDLKTALGRLIIRAIINNLGVFLIDFVDTN